MSPPKIFGLIGYPIQHSLSPAMHNAAFRALKIDAEYKLFPLKEQALKDFFKNFKENNIWGLNVTVPYKEKVLPLLDSISSEAKLIRAVNTIKVSHNRLEGFNTDGLGFLKHLTEDLKFNPQGKVIAIIGAGGAGRAVSVYLSKTKPKSISIYDIDKTKLSVLVNHLKVNFKDLEIKAASSIKELNIQESDLLINATPVGMKETDSCLIDERFIPKDILVYDLIYNPRETKLLKIAKTEGAKVSNGLGMLLYQGAYSFELWTQQRAPMEVMRKALMEVIDR